MGSVPGTLFLLESGPLQGWPVVVLHQLRCHCVALPTFQTREPTRRMESFLEMLVFLSFEIFFFKQEKKNPTIVD